MGGADAAGDRGARHVARRRPGGGPWRTVDRDGRLLVPATRLCVAIVDRRTFGGNIIETGSDSYRLAHTRARPQAAPGS
jgi:hypothetical protein